MSGRKGLFLQTARRAAFMSSRISSGRAHFLTLPNHMDYTELHLVIGPLPGPSSLIRHAREEYCYGYLCEASELCPWNGMVYYFKYDTNQKGIDARSFQAYACALQPYCVSSPVHSLSYSAYIFQLFFRAFSF